MPRITINGADLFYETQGSGPETIVFAHGLLWSGRMFDHQVGALKNRFRCITFDFRGQGKSGVTKTGYDMDSLTEDAAGLIEALQCAPCHFLGLSMGGFVGMRLAIRHPGWIKTGGDSRRRPHIHGRGTGSRQQGLGRFSRAINNLFRATPMAGIFDGRIE
jgi:3-oxoadipate enol-lactonase